MSASKTDNLLTRIADYALGIATLATRNSDALDFHTLPVWQIRHALKVAFEAGQRKPKTTRRKKP
jgi:hypothetical protein